MATETQQMKIEKYSVIVEAIQFLGDSNLTDCLNFVGKSGGDDETIISLDGFKVNKGEFIVKGMNGKFYSCKQDDFNYLGQNHGMVIEKRMVI